MTTQCIVITWSTATRCMRSASLLRVPKALRASDDDRGTPGSPPIAVAARPPIQVINEPNALGGSTRLVSPNVLALYGHRVGSAPTLRVARSRPYPLHCVIEL